MYGSVRLIAFCAYAPKKDSRGEASWTTTWPSRKTLHIRLLVCSSSGPNKTRSWLPEKLRGRMNADSRGTHGGGRPTKKPKWHGWDKILIFVKLLPRR